MNIIFSISNDRRLSKHIKNIYVLKNSDGISTRKIEGAHFESNNEYILKMYYKDPLNLCDRILSYKVVKSN